MKQILFIFVGGGLGATLRFLMTQFLSKIWSITFPVGILIVNILGCFVMGIAVSLFQTHSPQSSLHSFIIIGLLGGFTTFSSFTYDCVFLFQRGDFLMFGCYFCGSVILSVIFLLLGSGLVRFYST